MPYRIPAKVKFLELKNKVVHSKKEPTTDRIISTVITLGWFVNFEGSHESLFVGVDEPKDLKPGTEVDIIIVTRCEK